MTQDEMRERIRRERRVELAFEEHRSWDVRRWKIAQETLGGDLLGLEITCKNQARRAVTRNSVIPANEVPEGWHYYDGDEFNDLVINNSYWGQYGSDTPVGNSQYGQPTGNIQTYRKKQITIEKGSGGLSFARITATKDDNPPAPTLSTASTREGWWSGALSSRDTDKYGYQGNITLCIPALRFVQKYLIYMVYGWDRGVVIMQEPVLRNLTSKSFSSRNLRIRLHPPA